jgi:hypothetical protein
MTTEENKALVRRFINEVFEEGATGGGRRALRR